MGRRLLLVLVLALVLAPAADGATVGAKRLLPQLPTAEIGRAHV